MSVDFKGSHYPKPVILYAVYFYCRYAVSYRDQEEIMAERGVKVDHATLNRWVVKYSPDIAQTAQNKKRPTSISWRMDETYIKVKEKWMYLYRAVDKFGKTLEFMLSARRDRKAATGFFAQALTNNHIPDCIVIDKSGANKAGINSVNQSLKRFGATQQIKIFQSKYANNIIEQDHRALKRRTRPMTGFKSFTSATATLAGIETAHMIRKNQIPSKYKLGFQVFLELAA